MKGTTKLQRYFQRIHCGADAAPTVDTLRQVHRQHLLSIAYENADVLLGRRVQRDPDAIFRKLVLEGRGGWCYEMNGLLAWALEQVGFRVTQLSGAVMRRERGDETMGNHLVLRVDIEGQPWIADVGLGDGLFEPVPLEEGEIRQDRSRQYRLEHLPDGAWRFHNTAGAFPTSFDFYDRPAHAAELDAKCQELQTDPESIFVQNLICQRMTPEGTHLLLGRVHRPAVGDEKHLVESAEELRELLSSAYGLQLALSSGAFERLWQRVARRHDELFGDRSADEITLGAAPEEP